MCTVSIIPIELVPGATAGIGGIGGIGGVGGVGGAGVEAGGYRLVTNRDESHRRAPALPPEVRSGEGLFPALWPTDPEGGGTWVSVNAAGVTLALLNIYPSRDTKAPAPRGGRGVVSRGLIIPALAHAPSAADAAAALSALDLSAFRGFRLVAVDRESIIECRWEGEGESGGDSGGDSAGESGEGTGNGSGGSGLSVAETALGLACFSSHGWGDRHGRARLALFRRWFADRAASACEQDAFHRHQWASRPETSVRMVREDARTVSITSVTVGAEVSMRYEPLSAAGLLGPSTGPCDEGARELRIEAVEMAGKGDAA